MYDWFVEFFRLVFVWLSMFVGIEGRNFFKLFMIFVFMFLSVILKFGKVIIFKIDFVILIFEEFFVKVMRWLELF